MLIDKEYVAQNSSQGHAVFIQKDMLSGMSPVRKVGYYAQADHKGKQSPCYRHASAKTDDCQ